MTAPTFYPSLRYEDAPAAIEWLERTFGFERRMVVPGPGDTIAHAELSYGDGIVMLGSGTDYGSRDYAALDPEGNLWNFGTYRPAPGDPVD